MTWNGTNYIPVPEVGIEFKTSLVIEAKVTSGTAYGWAYRLYASTERNMRLTKVIQATAFTRAGV
jgi:hypothetical protein